MHGQKCILEKKLERDLISQMKRNPVSKLPEHLNKRIVKTKQSDVNINKPIPKRRWVLTESFSN